MKLIGILLSLWSFTAFSLPEFLNGDADASNSGGKKFVHWHGTGNVIHSSKDKREPYLVSLTIRKFGEHGSHFQYHVWGDKWSHHPSFIVKFTGYADGYAFYKVYLKENREAAESDSDIENMNGYSEAGWGYAVGHSMYLNYDDGNGNSGMQHYRGYRKGGKAMLASTGSMGNADGFQFAWTESLKQVFRHPIQSN